MKYLSDKYKPFKAFSQLYLNLVAELRYFYKDYVGLKILLPSFSNAKELLMYVQKPYHYIQWD